MNREETLNLLEKSQSLPHATIEDLTDLPKGISKEKLNDYLKDYLKPTGNCWVCGNRLWIEWGLQHGIAHCTNCGIDVRVYHFLENDKGERTKFERSLQYHPKNYSVGE